MLQICGIGPPPATNGVNGVSFVDQWMSRVINLSMVYKGNRQITTLPVPYKKSTFMLCFLVQEVPKSHIPLLSVPHIGVPYKTYWV